MLRPHAGSLAIGCFHAVGQTGRSTNRCFLPARRSARTSRITGGWKNRPVWSPPETAFELESRAGGAGSRPAGPALDGDGSCKS